MIAEFFGYAVLTIFLVALVALLIGNWQNEGFRTFVTNQFPAVVGLPTSGVFSFLIVAVFKSTDGPVKLEALGFKFEGASGPIVMWVFVFVAIVLAIKLLWR